MHPYSSSLYFLNSRKLFECNFLLQNSLSFPTFASGAERHSLLCFLLSELCLAESGCMGFTGTSFTARSFAIFYKKLFKEVLNSNMTFLNLAVTRTYVFTFLKTNYPMLKRRGLNSFECVITEKYPL